MKKLFHLNHKNAPKKQSSLLYRMHYLNSGINSPAYFTGAVQ